jgi:hypothetical protein
MATLPNSNITAVPPEAPEDDEFPTPDPINTFDLVGPGAANRQPNQFKTRDLTLRQRVNELVENMNEISTGDATDSGVLFLPRDGTNPMTGDLDLGGNQITNHGLLLATPTSTPDDYVQVSAGTYQKTTGKGYQDVNAQSVQITTPVGGGQTRYDLVHIDDIGNLGVTQGVAGTPGVVPEFPDDELMIAVIKVDETGTIVVNQADITDVRPFLAADQNARALQGESVEDTSPGTDEVLQYDGSKWAPSSVVTLPINHIGGLITSNNGSDALHDIDIAKGMCRDVDDTANMVLSSVLTKQIDVAWAVGDGNGGLDTGSPVASQLYLLWLIKRSDTGVVDAIFSILGLLEKVTTVSVATADDSYNDAVEDLSIFKPGQKIWVEGFTDGSNNGLKTVVTSAANKITVSENLADEAAGDTITITAQVTSPIMPTNYDKRRLIAAMRTDGSADILSYLQSGDYFRYMGDVIQDVLDTSITDAAFEVGTLSVPPKAMAHIYAHLNNNTTTAIDGILSIRTKGAADQSTAYEAWQYTVNAGPFEASTVIGQVLVDANRQVEYAASEPDGNAQVRINTFGFTMFSRREP